MNHWIRVHKDNKQVMWRYVDRGGEIRFIRCDADGWIDVKDLLPDQDEWVQVTFWDGRRKIAVTSSDVRFQLSEGVPCWEREAGSFRKNIGWQPKTPPMISRIRRQ